MINEYFTRKIFTNDVKFAKFVKIFPLKKTRYTVLSHHVLDWLARHISFYLSASDGTFSSSSLMAFSTIPLSFLEGVSFASCLDAAAMWSVMLRLEQTASCDPSDDPV